MKRTDTTDEFNRREHERAKRIIRERIKVQRSFKHAQRWDVVKPEQLHAAS